MFTYLDYTKRRSLLSGRQLVLSCKYFDEINAALPALEAAFIDARLDIMLAQPAIVDPVLAVDNLVVFSHELDSDIPELAAGQPQASLTGAIVCNVNV